MGSVTRPTIEPCLINSDHTSVHQLRILAKTVTRGEGAVKRNWGGVWHGDVVNLRREMAVSTQF